MTAGVLTAILSGNLEEDVLTLDLIITLFTQKQVKSLIPQAIIYTCILVAIFLIIISYIVIINRLYPVDPPQKFKFFLAFGYPVFAGFMAGYTYLFNNQFV